MSTPPDKKRKVHHVLESPHETPILPDLTSEVEEIILEMLCSLLEPIGTYRSQYIPPSKGKRQKKRKKRALKKSQAAHPRADVKTLLPPAAQVPPPPPPEISPHVLIGFNALNRHLTTLASFSAPAGPNTKTAEFSREPVQIPATIATIFYPKRDVSELLTNHLPLLSHLASRNQPAYPPIRLIPLSHVHTSKMLSKALHLPRVSFIGVLADGSSSTNALVKLCREITEPFRIPWLEHVEHGQYESVKVKRIDTFEDLGNKRKARKKTRGTPQMT